MAYIVVIDDEPGILETFEGFLRRAGHEVAVSQGYDEGVALLHERLPDMVFVDIFLGHGRSGMDIFQRLSGREASCPVVLITGSPDVDTAAAAVRQGAYDYMIKPVRKEGLLKCVNRAMEFKRVNDEKEHLRLLLDAVNRSVTYAIITVDPSLRVTLANPLVRDVLDMDPEAMLGADFREVFQGGLAAFTEVVSQTLRTREITREFRVERRGSEGPRVALLNCAPLVNVMERFLGAVLVIRDITRQEYLESQIKDGAGERRIVGKSRRVREIYELLDDLANTETTVLITGPSGTGKELVAEELHDRGGKKSKPLIKVNCSALSESLLESELFGHVRGAFTGALKDKVGRFQLAHGGSIFLDEIGDISPRIQLKLLRVLQEKEFERVGDHATSKVDARVIAATNQPLREKVKAGEFREDLYYRLKVVEITLPPLRERLEDLPLLVDHFIKLFNRQFNKGIQALSDEASSIFMRHAWPGNIRELKNAMEHAFIMCHGLIIKPEHLPRELRQPEDVVERRAEEGGLSEDMVRDALSRAGGNKAKAARILGVSRQTIYRKMREYEIA